MKLAFREYGQGRPLLILHGLFGQSDNWNTLAKQFAEKGFRVFTIDQRNHGLSPHSNDWNFQVMAEDVNELIKTQDLIDPILLGHSMGGKTVLFFEKEHPGLASKLVIADMSAREYLAHHASVLDALHAVDFNTIANRKEAEEVLNRYISDFGTKQFLLKNIYWKEGEEKKMAWRFNLEVISKEYDNIRAAVPFFTSTVPTLVVRGEKSDYVQESDMDDYKQRFSNFEFFTVPGAGHWVHAEKPKEFFEAVINFIA